MAEQVNLKRLTVADEMEATETERELMTVLLKVIDVIGPLRSMREEDDFSERASKDTTAELDDALERLEQILSP